MLFRDVPPYVSLTNLTHEAHRKISLITTQKTQRRKRNSSDLEFENGPPGNGTQEDRKSDIMSKHYHEQHLYSQLEISQTTKGIFASETSNLIHQFFRLFRHNLTGELTNIVTTQEFWMFEDKRPLLKETIDNLAKRLGLNSNQLLILHLLGFMCSSPGSFTLNEIKSALLGLNLDLKHLCHLLQQANEEDSMTYPYEAAYALKRVPGYTNCALV